jgi:transposase
MAGIENKIKEAPDTTLLELITEFKIGITESALSKKLKKLGYSYKKTNLSGKAGRSRGAARAQGVQRSHGGLKRYKPCLP